MNKNLEETSNVFIDYDRLKVLNENINRNILIKVRKEFYKGCSITRKLGNFKDYYEHNDSMENFVSKICKVYGGNDKFENSLNRLSAKIAKSINLEDSCIKVKKEEVKECLLIIVFWNSFIGYKNESIVYELLKNSGYFKVKDDKAYDISYAIDLVVNLKHEAYEGIGIQLKSKTYLGISNDKKEEHMNKQNKVAGIDKVYYLFHNNDGYKPFCVRGKMLLNNEIVCDKNFTFHEMFKGLFKSMKVSEYNYLIDEILELFYKKNNLGREDYDEWKEYIKGYENPEDYRNRMAEKIALECLNSCI